MSIWVLGILTIGASLAGSLVGLILTSRLTPKGRRRQHQEVAGFIFAVVGVIYAVLLAFVVIMVWEEFSEAESYAAHEANAVKTVFRLSPSFPSAVKHKLRAELRVYAHSVVEKEWQTMATGKSHVETDEALDRLFDNLADFTPSAKREEILYEETLTQLIQVSNSRRLRLFASNSGVPMIMWFVLYAGAFVTVTFSFLFEVDRLSAHALMSGALAVLIGLSLLLISALNFPFSGDVRVRPEAFEAMLERMDKIEANEKKSHQNRVPSKAAAEVNPHEQQVTLYRRSALSACRTSISAMRSRNLLASTLSTPCITSG